MSSMISVKKERKHETEQASGNGGPGGGGFGNGEKPKGMQGEKPEGAPDGSFPGNGETDYAAVDDIARNGNSASGLDLSGTYETAQDYIDALNANGTWVTYDAETDTAAITSIEDFVTNMKTASKSLGAFDQLDGGQGENELFGYGDGNGAHFDSTLASILNELGSEYAADYEADFIKTDSLGTDVQTRVNMYTPLYCLMESSEGYGTSTPAKYWRIRTGICQSDTALTTEVNLALALESNDAVFSVDFATVWEQGHTKAERSGADKIGTVAFRECLSVFHEDIEAWQCHGDIASLLRVDQSFFTEPFPVNGIQAVGNIHVMQKIRYLAGFLP